MVRNSATLQIKLEVDSKTGKVQLLDVGKAGKKAGDDIQHGFNKAGSSAEILTKKVSNLYKGIAAAAAAYSIGKITYGFVETASEFEQLEIRLKTIMGSSEKAKQSLDWITDFTAKTPYELKDVSDAFVKLQAYGLDAFSTLGLLGDTASSMGKSINDAVEMYADAVVGEFERLKEFGVRAKQEGENVTFSWNENGKQMVVNTQKTQEGISQALSQIFKRFKGGMAAQSESFQGMMSNISDQWHIFQKDVMTSGPFKVMKDQIKLYLIELDKFKKEGRIDEWTANIASNVLESFRLMSYGPELVINSIKGIKIVYHGAMSAILSLADKGLATIVFFTEMQQKIAEGIDYLESKIGLDLVDPQHLKDQIKEIENWRKNLNEKNDGAIISVMGLMDSINNTHEGFAKTRSEIDKLVEKISDSKNVNNQYAGSFDNLNNSVNNVNKSISTTKKQIKDFIKLGQKTPDDFWMIQAKDRNNVRQREYQVEIDLANDAQQKQKEYFENIQNYAQRTAQSIQYSLGDYLYNGLSGKWDDLGDVFTNVVNRMIADVTAAQIQMAIIGDYAKTGNAGGLIGLLGSMFGSMFGGAAASAAPVHVGTGGTTAFGMANGGLIAEPVLGFGAKSGASYLFGESGPEFVIPDKKVKSITDYVTETKPEKNVTNVNVIVHNNASNAQATVKRTQKNNELQLDVFIEQLDAEFAKRANQGRLQFDHAISNLYDLQRRGY